MRSRATLQALCILAWVTGCSGADRATTTPIGNTQAASEAPPASADLVGVWMRSVGAGETQYLRLFRSGVLGFQHVGRDLPISRSVGTWTLSESWLGLKIEGDEPNTEVFPLPWLLEVTLAGDRLRLHADTKAAAATTTWTRVAEPYGSTSGVEQRAASDEQSWTELLKRAESAPRF